ncbi:hypothetical protein [uncultured Tissierella sp.]|uniref:hypothetical protein n=1 Tax=uncultured Tissierella sp. TaxID=448160 RepID=UPI00280499EA|nr:hypothetical protein [uncultured Tissierella sp.]MDU5080240.1 hypothetical protein [Bacillota bacterium]
MYKYTEKVREIERKYEAESPEGVIDLYNKFANDERIDKDNNLDLSSITTEGLLNELVTRPIPEDDDSKRSFKCYIDLIASNYERIFNHF